VKGSFSGSWSLIIREKDTRHSAIRIKFYYNRLNLGGWKMGGQGAQHNTTLSQQHARRTNSGIPSNYKTRIWILLLLGVIIILIPISIFFDQISSEPLVKKAKQQGGEQEQPWSIQDVERLVKSF
jgi:hypothetical protein